MNILFIQSPIYDYLTATLVEGLMLLGHHVVCSENSNYGNKIDDSLLFDYAESADLIILGSNIGVRSYLLQGVKNPKKVFVDGSDCQELQVINNIRFKAIFKRELSRKYLDAEKDFVFPLPFAAERRYFIRNTHSRDLLVTFLANMNTNPLRYSIHQRLRNYGNPRIVSGTTNERAYDPLRAQSSPMEVPTYRNLIHRSLVSINVAGAGYDCARYWEILASGALLFTQELDIVIPNGFADGHDCVIFRSLDEFDAKIDYYINHQKHAADIAIKGHRRLLSFHTTRARAQYFLSKVMMCIDREGYCYRFLHPEIRSIETICSGSGIDVGCGSTKTTPECIGVDITPGGLVGSVGSEDGQVSCGNIAASGDSLHMFGDESLDFVVARHNLEHYHDPAKTLQEWKRVLKKGGRLGLVVLDHEQVDTYQLNPTHFCHFTEGSLAELVNRVGGLKIEKIEKCVPNWSILGIFYKEA